MLARRASLLGGEGTVLPHKLGAFLVALGAVALATACAPGGGGDGAQDVTADTGVVTACADGVDNDGDGRIDLEEPG